MFALVGGRGFHWSQKNTNILNLTVLNIFPIRFGLVFKHLKGANTLAYFAPKCVNRKHTLAYFAMPSAMMKKGSTLMTLGDKHIKLFTLSLTNRPN